MTDDQGSDQTPSDPQRTAPGHRPWRRVFRVAFGLIVLGGVAYFLLKAHSTVSEIRTVMRHFNLARLPWLLVCVLAEALSFWCYALVQRTLLLQGGARLTRLAMLGLAVAATGLTNLVPGGTAPASGWLVRQYRDRGIPLPLALWAVTVGGLAAMLSVLLLVLVGAAIAGLINPAELAALLALLGAATVGVTAALRHLDALERFVTAHNLGRFDAVLARATKGISQTKRFHSTPGVSTRVVLLSLGNWGLDVVCLAAAFLLLGSGVPWHSVLFAYAVAQVAGSVAPVPAGIGFVEGGLVGAFALAGTPVGPAILATIVYRLITSVGVALVGSAALVYLTRWSSVQQATLSPPATDGE